MKRCVIVLTAMLFCISCLYSQKEYNNWCFWKGVHITFNTADGKPAYCGKTPYVYGIASSSVSDKHGNLLFYTNGKTIWNSKHQAINKDDNLTCSSNDNQLTLIAPQPGNENIFYLFTVNEFINDKSEMIEELYYSVIDLSSGSPEIIQKNISLNSTASGGRITAAKHSNKKDYWVIVKDVINPKFYAFLINSKGINPPLVSIISDTTNKLGQWTDCIKVSQNSKLIASVNSGINSIELYDFNNQTGRISNKRIPVNSKYEGYFKSLEFSPNSRFLYATFNDLDSKKEFPLLQIDMSKSLDKMIDSSVIIKTNCLAWMQTGPDNRIYLAKYNPYDVTNNSLDRINTPDSANEKCNFQLACLTELNGLITDDLPNIVIPTKGVYCTATSSTEYCEGDTIFLYSQITSSTSGVAKVLWKGPNGFESSVENPIIPNSNSDMSGVYKLFAFYRDDLDSANVNIKVNSKPEIEFNFTSPHLICKDSSTILFCKSDQKIASCLWSNGKTSDTISVSTPGIYSVTITDIYGCKNTDSIEVRTIEIPQAKISASAVSLCEGETAILRAEPDGFSYKWSTGETAQSITVNQAGKYILEVSNELGCGTKDSIKISVTPNISPKILVSGNNPACEGDTVVLSSDIKGSSYNYLWSTGETAESIKVTRKGNYYLTVSIGQNCKGTDSLLVDFASLPKPKITGKNVICSGETAVLTLSEDFADYLWSIGDTSKTIQTQTEGLYKVTVHNKTGCIGYDSILVSKHNVNISDISEIRADSVCMKHSSEKEFVWKNTADSCVINSIYFKTNKNFKLLNPAIFPFLAVSGADIKLRIQFNPDEPIDYIDTLVCEISSPCPKLYSAIVSGTGTAEIILKLKEQSALIRENVCMPIFISSLCSIDSLPANDFYVKISFPFDAINLHNQRGVVTNGRKAIDTLYNKLSASDKETKIDDICGIALLGTYDINDFKIDTAYSLNPNIRVRTANADLIVSGLCKRDYLRLKSFQLTEFRAICTNETAKIEILTQENGKFALAFYSTEGIKQKEIFWSKNNNDPEQKIININLENLASGVYFAVLKTDRSFISKPIMVFK